MAYEDAKAERDFRQNPPSTAPGQGSGDEWSNMAVGSSSVENLSDSYQSDINSALNNANQTVNQQNANQQNMIGIQNANMYKTTEDRIFDLAEMGGKGIFIYLKALVQSLRNNSEADWHYLGEGIIKTSLVCIGVGFVGCIIEMITQNGNHPIELIFGSLYALIVGVVLIGKFKSGKSSADTVEDAPVVVQEDIDWSAVDAVYDDGGSIDGDGSYEEDEEEDWDAMLNSLNEIEKSNANVISSNTFDTQSAIDSLPTIQQGTQTRQYLFEAFSKVLPTCTPDYATMKEIYSDCDTFYDFEMMMRNAAMQVGMREENLPELNNLYENPFIYRLNCSRPTGMKEQAIADELANTFSRDANNMLVRFGVYATVETSTGICSINLFKGFTEDALGNQVGGVKITLGDVYRQISQFISSPQIEFPFVWGINELGKTLYCDMKDNNSIIICGEPRGGKSWKGQSILAQFAMYHSPKEVQFYVLDNKDKASDYRYPATVLPHIRYFCGNPDKINESLEKIINHMMNSNGQKMSDEGFINIKDYNAAHPGEKLPYCYVVIDELQALMDHFEKTGQKEEAAKFRGHLSTIVSKLPYTGLRLILFPHRIVDQIISKNTYSLVSSRAVVNQLDGKLVENSVGITEAKFGHKLAQKGDMAIRLHELNGGEACFCHAEVLTFSNETNKKLFEYIGAVWRKLEPDVECIEINGQIGGRIGDAPTVKASRVSKPARDNTSGRSSFAYDGSDFNSDSDSEFTEGSSIDDLLGEGFFDGEEEDTDESFWDSLNDEGE